MPMTSSLESTTAASPSTPKHQFVAIEQQKAAASAGMWLFLSSEVMFFGALFSAYFIYAYLYPEVFAHFSHKMHLILGSINTAVLLSSSWTMALAVHAAQTRQRKKLLILLALTSLMGLLFLAIKGYEWFDEISGGEYPGSPAITPRQGEIFLRLYFIMTGLHGLHVLIGVLLMLGLSAYTLRQKDFSVSRVHVTENLGLYWHFVDIVWIFLFPMLYLLDEPRLPW